MGRLYRGAFDRNADSYFRSDDDGMQNTKFIPALDILVAVRDKHRRISAIHMALMNGITLPLEVMRAYYTEMENTRRSRNPCPPRGVHLHQDHIQALTNTEYGGGYGT